MELPQFVCLCDSATSSTSLSLTDEQTDMKLTIFATLLLMTSVALIQAWSHGNDRTIENRRWNNQNIQVGSVAFDKL